MKRIRTSVWLTAGALVVAGNLYLTLKEDSKADRSQWLTSWTQAAEGDVVETFQTTGVLVPAEEYPVYFDSSKGTFLRFLVEEGQEVDAGTPLFEYSSAPLDREVKELEAEKAQIETKIRLADEQISQLQSKLSSLESDEDRDSYSTDSYDAETNSESIEIQIPKDYETAKAVIENEILEQQTTKRELEEQANQVDTRIKDTKSQKSELIVKSETEGIVKELNKTLGNPIITLRSKQAAVQGSFDEQQMSEVQEELAIRASVDQVPGTLEGKITNIEKYPAQGPSVQRQSLYPFIAQLDENSIEGNKQLLPGMKANVTVITDEALQAVTVPVTALLKSGDESYVYVLNDKARLERRAVEPGLLVDGLQEITSGLEAGEEVVSDPEKLMAEHGFFVTPVDYQAIDKSEYDNMTAKEKFKFILMGLFS